MKANGSTIRLLFERISRWPKDSDCESKQVHGRQPEVPYARHCTISDDSLPVDSALRDEVVGTKFACS